MIAELKLWVVLAVLSALTTIAAFLLKLITSQVIKRLDTIVSELRSLSHAALVQEQQIKSLQESDHQHTQRLNNHAERIRTIEFDHC